MPISYLFKFLKHDLVKIISNKKLAYYGYGSNIPDNYLAARIKTINRTNGIIIIETLTQREEDI